MKSLSLEHSILCAISFFDSLSYPLTVAEIEEFLMFYPNPVGFVSILEALDFFIANKRIESSNGMYALAGRKDLIMQRLAKYVPNEKKYRIACRMSAILSHIPFVRMICVVNSLSLQNAQEESDIDLFIVAKHSHIWLTRLLVVAALDLMRARPRAAVRKNMICTCFFASCSSLDFSSLQIPRSVQGEPPCGIPDIYLAWWVSRFVPLYDHGGYAEKLFSSNEWAREVFGNRRLYRTVHNRMVRQNFFGKSVKTIAERILACIGGALERASRAIQFSVLPYSLRSICNMDSRVVMNDNVLKFHIRDMREKIRTSWHEKCKLYGIRFLP